MIEVGDEVVCINDNDPEQSDAPFVIKGRTYTVTRIEQKPWPVAQFGPIIIFEQTVMIWVEGLPSATGHFGFRFQKIEKKKDEAKTDTDITIFKKMLEKV